MSALRERRDVVMAKLLQGWRAEPRGFIEEFLYIRDKQRRTVPLKLNPAQGFFYNHRTGRDQILKPRQLGFTTLACALFLTDTLLHGNTHSVIIAHSAESAETIFEIVRFMHKHLPSWWHEHHPPSRASRSELYFPTLDSRFSVGTAGSVDFGRGQTINNLLCSEVAHWRRGTEALAALLAAVPAQGHVILESTPNGLNHFYDAWQEARRQENGFSPCFFTWWDDASYRLPGPPLGELLPDERALQRDHGLDEDQLRWRRAKQRELGARFPQEFAEDDSSCFLASGRCCFATAVLVRLREEARRRPPRRLEVLPVYRYFHGGRTQVATAPIAPGRLSIWRDPEPSHEYVIGADVAEGLEGGDYSAAVVIDRASGEEVAELHGHWRPDVFARLLAGLGVHYRLADLAVESNGHGGTTLHVLRSELFYRRLFYYVNPREKSRPQLGWPTNSFTKPLMIDQLAAAIAEGGIVLRSPFLIDECLTFVSKEDGSQEAEEGKYDDLVIAAALAWQVRQRPVARTSSQRPPGW